MRVIHRSTPHHLERRRKPLSLVVLFVASSLATLPAAALPTTSISSPFDFGPVPLNNELTENFTVSPDAGYSLELASGSGLNSPFGFSFNGCVADSTCSVAETFDPTGLGPFSATTNVFECPDFGGSCIAASTLFTGTGISIFDASSTLDFANTALNTTTGVPISLTADTGYSI